VRQEIIEKLPEAKLRIYAVWMPVLGSDSRGEWDAGLLADSRVTSFWDEALVTGHWFADRMGLDRPLFWDAYALFGPDARWDDVPQPLVSWGAPVIGVTSRLERDLQKLVSR
jgi:hypothetical protein